MILINSCNKLQQSYRLLSQCIAPACTSHLWCKHCVTPCIGHVTTMIISLSYAERKGRRFPRIWSGIYWLFLLTFLQLFSLSSFDISASLFRTVASTENSRVVVNFVHRNSRDTANSERQPITGVWMQSPGQGLKPPEAENFLSFGVFDQTRKFEFAYF